MDATNLRKRFGHLIRSSLASAGGCSRSAIASSVEEPIFLFPSSFGRLPRRELRLTERGLPYHAGTELDGRTCPPVSPASLPPTKKDSKGKSKLLLSNNPYGFTTTSDDDPFSSGLEEDHDGCRNQVETETLFSSRSFSSDSSELYYYSSRRRHRPRPRRRRKREGVCSASTSSVDGFHPLVSLEGEESTRKEEEEEGGGFAVVKETSDPYGDFRSSMLEMIMERQLFGADELEGLLRSYLCLNSRRHHKVILRVFSDICEALFA